MRNYELISSTPSLINWGVKQNFLTQKDIDNPEYCYINEFDLPKQQQQWCLSPVRRWFYLFAKGAW